MSTSREVVVYDPKTPAALPDPWLRQPAEPEDAWACFVKYRDQPLPRQFRFLAVRHDTVRDYARDWRWHERVEAYDNAMQAITVAERQAAIASVARDAGAKDAVVLMRGYDLLVSELDKLLRISESREFEQTSVMRPGELIKLAELIMKMKRLTAGEATENVGVAIGFAEKLSDEDQLALFELTRKAGA